MLCVFFVAERKSFEKVYFGESLPVSPCLQVLSYNYSKPYFEISYPIESFCVNAWCGFNNFIIKDRSPSLALCLPDK